jgi:uncharacterized protein
MEVAGQQVLPGSPLLAAFRRILRHPVPMMIIGMAIVIAGIVAAGSLSHVLRQALGKSGAVQVAEGAITALFAAIMYWVFVRFVERKQMAELAPGGLRQWMMGLGIGVGVMAASIAIIAAFGGYRITGANALAAALPMLGLAIMSGVWEEIALRGLIFRFLEKWLGSWAGLGLSAALFGAGHIGNPNASWLAAAAIALEAGVSLAALYMMTRSLWAPIGMHMAWNFTQGGIFGVAVSGFDAKGLLSAEMKGPDLLTGGSFGAEASLPALLVCTAAGAWFLWIAHKRRHFVAPSWARFKSGEGGD